MNKSYGFLYTNYFILLWFFDLSRCSMSLVGFLVVLYYRNCIYMYIYLTAHRLAGGLKKKILKFLIFLRRSNNSLIDNKTFWGSVDLLVVNNLMSCHSRQYFIYVTAHKTVTQAAGNRRLTYHRALTP